MDNSLSKTPNFRSTCSSTRSIKSAFGANPIYLKERSQEQIRNKWQQKLDRLADPKQKLPQGSDQSFLQWKFVIPQNIPIQGGQFSDTVHQEILHRSSWCPTGLETCLQLPEQLSLNSTLKPLSSNKILYSQTVWWTPCRQHAEQICWNLKSLQLVRHDGYDARNNAIQICKQ